MLINLKSVDKFEIIVVDDHSNDNTFRTVKHLNDNCFSAIRLSKQSGSHSAIRAGTVCLGDATFCLSADGQDDPSLLPEMIDLLNNNYEVVWAQKK